jgi:hypothetical protein
MSAYILHVLSILSFLSLTILCEAPRYIVTPLACHSVCLRPVRFEHNIFSPVSVMLSECEFKSWERINNCF